MNPLTTRIITSILETEEAWHHETRRLRYQHVLAVYGQIREALFTDQVTFPAYGHAVALLRAVTADLGERERHFEWSADMDWWVLLECDRPDCPAMQAQRYLSELVESRILDAWNSERWQYEHPTEAEILALGIRPSLVPAVEIAGNLQTSLF